MDPTRELYKTTIVVYTDYDTRDMEIDAIAKEAIGGAAICVEHSCDESEREDTPEGVLSFFGMLETEENDEDEEEDA
jgi:hypothetical protein